MQLELNFPTMDLQTSSKEFFDTMYSVLIWMQILSGK